MNDTAAMAREIEGLRARLSALSAASLRISASLDLHTVLREVAQSACALTGARYAAIATIDATGRPVDVVTQGFAEAEHRAMAEWSDGPRLFEHFRDLEGSLRITEVAAYDRLGDGAYARFVALRALWKRLWSSGRGHLDLI
ncbi:MAG: hypothetical protein OXG51_13890 [Gammaproteobacteria bacterium]|nr:hypothetical protein [Gammaproteobacteria bacterium]